MLLFFRSHRRCRAVSIGGVGFVGVLANVLASSRNDDALLSFRMIIFLSDIHLGRGGPSEARRREADVIEFLKSHRPEVEHLYLLGDVFEEFIEYDHLIPKGFARFQGLLAEWADAGVPITYLVGNHDPWHQSYFEREIGITVEHGSLLTAHHGRRLHLAHGDGLVASSRLNAWLRGWLRHPIPVWIYRHALPGDVGMSLARFVNSTFGKRELDFELIEALRRHAGQILADSAVDAVIFGHSHYAEHHMWQAGEYLNTGYWHESRTFGALVDGALHLMRWNGQSTAIVER